METPTITIEVKQDGTMKFEVAGVSGDSCIELTKALTELGQANITPKQEMYEGPVEVQTDISIGL